MHLFLVRHGETVDNVAGLYAGSRDSALTAHGVLQTRRLGGHLADAERLVVRRVFSSNLQRAVQTAQAVLDAQHDAGRGVEVVQLPELREKDFGSGEGERFGKGERRPHVGAETAEAMRLRADRFLDEHLFPVLRAEADDDDPAAENAACVVVAHGLILSTLFRALCARVLPGHLTLAPDIPRVGSEHHASLPVLPSWSNTGYLHGILFPPAVEPPSDESRDGRQMLPFKLHISGVNCTSHNKGLKKTRGGIGSAQHDVKQKSLDGFFTKAKKRKADEAAS